MLRELENIKQVVGDPRRRWFTDDYFDIIVFYDQDDKPLGFHLCYCKNENERILVWKKNAGYQHGSVDAGKIFFGRRKGSPLMVSDGLFEKPTVTEYFHTAKSGIDSVVADFIENRIAEHNFA